MHQLRVIFGAGFAIAALLAALASWRTGDPDTGIAAAPQISAPNAAALPASPEKAPVKRLGSFAPPLPEGPFARTAELPGALPVEPLTPEPAPVPERQTANIAPVKTLRARPAPAPAAPAPQPQAWMRHAAAAPANPGRLPLIAIVIDDLGAANARIAPVLALPAPMTMAVLPYAPAAARAAHDARLGGHEVLVHLPMQADGAQDPGPGALLAGLGPEEFARRIAWNLSRLEGYVGVNNHMGSYLTQNPGAMAMLMAELGRRGLLFLDSRTAQRTVAARAARAAGMTALERDVFLDNEITPEHVRAQLRKAEEIALQKGHAIAIGHPHAVTIAALAEWAAGLEARGFLLAPLSAVARLDAERQQLVALPPR